MTITADMYTGPVAIRRKMAQLVYPSVSGQV